MVHYLFYDLEYPMPIKSCQRKGKPGKKYGNHGACYTGTQALQKAAKQGRAIEISRHRKKR